MHASRTRAARPAELPQLERRLAELVDLLWQTDELRIVRPEPTDEARTATYYLHTIAAQRRARPARGARPHARDHRHRAARPTARPLRFGAWAGGDRDGNPNVTPAVTLEVIGLQHDAGLRDLIAGVEDLLPELSSSTRVVAVTDELRASLERDAEALPITFDAVRRLNAEEPYRLKLSFVRVRLQRTRDRLAHGTPHEPGRDYAGLDELLADLDARSATRCSPAATADRRRRDPAADPHGDGHRSRSRHARHPRAQRASHHAALADLYDRIGELDTPLRRARPSGAHRACSPARWLAASADGRSATTCPPRQPRSSSSLRRDPRGPGHLRPARPSRPTSSR